MFLACCGGNCLVCGETPIGGGAIVPCNLTTQSGTWSISPALYLQTASANALKDMDAGYADIHVVAAPVFANSGDIARISIDDGNTFLETTAGNPGSSRLVNRGTTIGTATNMQPTGFSAPSSAPLWCELDLCSYGGGAFIMGSVYIANYSYPSSSTIQYWRAANFSGSGTVTGTRVGIGTGATVTGNIQWWTSSAGDLAYPSGLIPTWWGYWTPWGYGPLAVWQPTANPITPGLSGSIPPCVTCLRGCILQGDSAAAALTPTIGITFSGSGSCSSPIGANSITSGTYGLTSTFNVPLAQCNWKYQVSSSSSESLSLQIAYDQPNDKTTITITLTYYSSFSYLNQVYSLTVAGKIDATTFGTQAIPYASGSCANAPSSVSLTL